MLMVLKANAYASMSPDRVFCSKDQVIAPLSISGKAHSHETPVSQALRWCSRVIPEKHNVEVAVESIVATLGPHS